MSIYLDPSQHLKRNAQSYVPSHSKIKHLGAVFVVVWTLSGLVAFTFTMDA